MQKFVWEDGIQVSRPAFREQGTGRGFLRVLGICSSCVACFGLCLFCSCVRVALVVNKGSYEGSDTGSFKARGALCGSRMRVEARGSGA